MKHFKNFIFTLILLLLTPTLAFFANEEITESGIDSSEFQSIIDSVDEKASELESELSIRRNSLSSEQKITQFYEFVENSIDYSNLSDEQQVTLTYATIEAETKLLNGTTPVKGNGEPNPLKTRAVDLSWSDRVGNVLNSLQSKTYGFSHGHSAIVTGSNKMVIEATTTSVASGKGAKVFYWSYTNMWKTGYFTDVVEYYVQGASWGAYNNVVRYASGQVGEPYGLKASVENDTEWYCSKLVYKSWQFAGYNLKNGIIDNSVAGKAFFLPRHIQQSPITRIYKRIGKGSIDY